ncbi:MAG: DegT/DnrJ/EryC1/StrS family aminotransferase, partial [Deltaproteobacteria bacterium]|nr:DegT/DnrJ/EryC1/StrS family aminotransferase [Deltaproteobacteria bacterium]
RTVFLTTGPRTAEFERAFADLLGGGEAIGTSSCTGALHLVLTALGIKPGDEVIVPAMTFLATVTPIWFLRARPVLADVDASTGLLDPSEVERRLTPRTRAVLPVHLYGAMADMHTLAPLCRRRGIALVEDSAHCIEGSRNGVRPGELSEAACFSFYATKNLSCGEGGAVLTRNPELAERLRRLRLHGVTRNAAARHAGPFSHWDMTELGYKYNMGDIQAALLLPQLSFVAERLARRQAVAARYEKAFSGLGVPFHSVPQDAVSARHLFTILVPGGRRDALAAWLTGRGVGCAVNYRAVHTLTYFRKRLKHAPEAFPNALRIGDSTLSLPCYPSLSDAEADYVIESVAEGLRRIG